jgi:hypothetical protein
LAPRGRTAHSLQSIKFSRVKLIKGYNIKP